MVGVPSAGFLMALIASPIGELPAHHLGRLRIEDGYGVEHRLDLHAYGVALREQTLDLRFEPVLLVEQRAELAADGRDLALQSLLLLPERFGKLDGAVNFIFEVRELFKSGQSDHLLSPSGAASKLPSDYAPDVRASARVKNQRLEIRG